ncbi:MAG: metallophosphoesterase [Labilithrix sp.]|nr:metallophosphoesterase [Labilithrix sp.]MCW5815588.1 metallophosphoesterase [Labilithrix sp.]
MAARSLLALLFTGLLVACGSEGGRVGDEHGEDDATSRAKTGSDGDGVSDAEEAAAVRERPWEILSNKNETLLSNVFYAEPSENEQIMPWTVDGRTQIDRLIYPTLGNPNLYVKSDASDELVVVLRLEPDAYAHLAPNVLADGAVTLKDDAEDALAFFLVARAARAAAEAKTAQEAKAGVFRIKPARIVQSPEPSDMPVALKKRHTLRAIFDRAAMADVPADLYDTRFEVRKGGALFANVYEYQYNAVRVFDDVKEEYTALNVTDTQVSVSAEYKTLTAEKLEDFVDGVNAETSPDVKNAAFITFNGDLHNGGSPGSIFQRNVATTYMREASRVLGALKRLRLPIFLTAGNHDGYAAIGHVPAAVAAIDARAGSSLEEVIDDQNAIAWPGYSFSDYSAFLARTAATPGGLPKDIVAGSFERLPGDSFGAGWTSVPRADRNMVLYDGFYQWQKTYGPLTSSWTFGKNRYVSMNSYELRQHRRTGWGMYTVNYGGGMSKVQLEWLDRELVRGKAAGEDVVLLMHHDPRGGHKGEDHGYYMPVVDYRGIGQSTLNYLLSEQLTPLVCKKPELSMSVDERDSCRHDGLQEWMAPDGELDKDGAGYFMSGVELLRRISASAQVRTLVLGHVHFNSLEVLVEDDPLVPNRLSLEGSADGGARELAVLRFGAGSDLSDQKYEGKPLFGYAVLHVTKETDTPRINAATYFAHGAAPASFAKVLSVDIDRTKSLRPKDAANPLDKVFDW